MQAAREEVLQWWAWQGFARAVPCRILSAALLSHLVNLQLHPDPWVAEMLPRVLEQLFGVQISCDTFMNRLLPRLGGYISAGGIEVMICRGLPLLTDAQRCAESLLVFLRQWSDLVLAAEEFGWGKARARQSTGQQQHLPQTNRRCSDFKMDTFLDEVLQSGHSLNDVERLLEGIDPIPDHILRIPVDERRYRVRDEDVRRWELLTDRHYDLVDLVQKHHRELGPYIDLDLDNPQQLADVFAGLPVEARCLTNPDAIKAATKRYLFEDEDEDPEDPSSSDLHPDDDISDFLALRLISAPPDLCGEQCPSTFLRFLLQDGKILSRRCLQGLPALPWCIGSDQRNTVVLDLPCQGIAPFQCIIAEAKMQVQRAMIVPLGGPSEQMYFICPKYQPLQVRNGDRLVCHGWTFELRIEPAEDTRTSSLTILTSEGVAFEVPTDGCHVGVGERSRKREHQPAFPEAKFVLAHTIRDIAEVHIAFHYDAPMDRWTVIDHSQDSLGTLLALKTGVAYLLSRGLRLKLGPLLLEATLDTGTS